jgi:NAD(P)H-hydrate epimerase
LLAGRDAVGVGPGLGSGSVARDVVHELIRQVTVPLVLDADALNAVAAEDMSFKRGTPTIVTPHSGEFVRLTGRSSEDVAAHRQLLATEYAAQNNVIVVLKGPATIVTDGVQTYINATGNSGMATGGTGDVLTGVIAALCGQGMQPYEAAVAGVYAHGLAGDMVAAATSERGMIASDLLDWLPHVWSRIDHEGAISS